MSKATKEWDRIEDILETHEPYPGKEIGEKLCFYEDVDYYEVVNKKLVVNCEKYNLVKENDMEPDTSPDAYEEQKALEEEKEYSHAIGGSKEDRNTMVSDRVSLEKGKEEIPDYTRSLNEFQSDFKHVTFKSQTLNMRKQRSKGYDKGTGGIKMDDLSSSSESMRSGGSELDYRERKRKSIKYIEKAKMKVTRKTDPNEQTTESIKNDLDLLRPLEHDLELEMNSPVRRSSSVHRG
jgi:hypothetical protein